MKIRPHLIHNRLELDQPRLQRSAQCIKHRTAGPAQTYILSRYQPDWKAGQLDIGKKANHVAIRSPQPVVAGSNPQPCGHKSMTMAKIIRPQAGAKHVRRNPQTGRRYTNDLLIHRKDKPVGGKCLQPPRDSINVQIGF